MIKSPNFWKNRQDPETGIRYKPEALVLHITDSSLWSTKSWFEDPHSQVSSHWVVDADGRWIPVVDEKDAAWANGLKVNPTWEGLKPDINPNLYSISVEVVSFGQFPSFKQWSSWVKGCKQICLRWNIPMDNLHIVNHNEIRADKRCPGRWFSKFYLILLSRVL